jgi:ABC-2 type transport system permease protein
MGTFHIIISIFLSLFFPNLIQIPRLIKEGRLDDYLLKPVNTQFIVSTKIIDIGSFGNIVLGAALVINSLHELGLKPDLYSFLFYIIYIILGVLIMYSILFILLSSAFWLQDSSWSIGFFMTFNSFGDKPINMYKGVLYRFLIYLFPIGLVANIPSNKILGKTDSTLEYWIILVTIVLLSITNYIWKKGLKLYEGASS